MDDGGTGGRITKPARCIGCTATRCGVGPTVEKRSRKFVGILYIWKSVKSTLRREAAARGGGKRTGEIGQAHAISGEEESKNTTNEAVGPHRDTVCETIGNFQSSRKGRCTGA